MRYRLLFIVFIKIFGAWQLSAQIDLKANLAAAANKRIDLAAEYYLFDQLGLEVYGGLNFKPWGDGVEINGQKIDRERNGYFIGAKANYYLGSDPSLDGFFLAPYVTYRSDKIQFDQELHHTRLSGGLMLGNKKFINDRFGYAYELGVGYNFRFHYDNTVTGKCETVEENIPIIGNLIQTLDIPFRVSLFYRF